MNISSVIAVYIVKTLILIGELTLYILNLFLYFLPRIIFGKFVDLLQEIKRQIGKGTTSIFSSKIKISKRVSKKKKKGKPKPIKIFPFSTFWIKVRYLLAGFVLSSIFVFLPLLILIFIQDLPSPRTLVLQDSALTTKIYDRNGTILYQIFANQNRTFVRLSEIPKTLQQATISIEDKDFYKNPGFEIQAIVRSAIANLSGKPIQGGSTITQQLIKSELLTPQVSIGRKIKEIILAFWAEKIYTKNQILEMYLNEIPYGGSAWGIEAASQTYFGKHAKDLDLSESSFLAGLPNAPTDYSPYGENPDLWKKRQEEVLSKMQEQGYISKDEKESAEKKELTFLPRQNSIHAPHFVMYVKDLLIKKYGLAMVERGGLIVRTTLDLKIQENAEKIVKDKVEQAGYLNLTNGASLITNPKNGDILAMIGSKDYDDPNGGNYNVTTALRQPGSSIKVITYTNALLKGFTAATSIQDAPITFASVDGGPSYSPVNYDGRFHGTLTLRQALANSINIPAVKLLNAQGVPSMVDLAKKMGITTWGDSDRYGLSITLGAAEVKMTEMATVYGTLANNGEKIELNPILEIKDSKGDTIEKKQTDGRKIIDPGVAFIISDILSDNNARAMEFGTNSPLTIENQTVSVKTGTSDNKRDNWTIGYTPSYVVAVWVGNNDNSPMDPTLASGITGAAPIWHDIMVNLLTGKSSEKEPMPTNIITKSCFGKTEYFIKGTEDFVNCNLKRTSQAPTP